MFKLALNAGHFLNTPGKRCLKSIDENETREWVLNSRICEYVEKELALYKDISLLRIDDKSGETDIPLSERAKKANNFDADIYISVHHNAGINGGDGGGIMAYTYLSVDAATAELQKLLYEKTVNATGLKGNRASPKATADFAELRETKMPAVLLEMGFMDSTTDTPVILTDTYAQKAAKAIADAVAEFANLTKTETELPEQPDTETPEEIPTDLPTETDGVIYRVQAGAFRIYENAADLVNALHEAGFDAFIKKENENI